jgi:hypothetical protein
MPIDHDRRKSMLGHIDRWKSSGMSQRDYFTQEGIDFKQFYYWYRVYKGKATKKRSVNRGFVPIRITEDINDGQLQAILVKGFNSLVATFPAKDASILLIPQLPIG